MQVLILGATGFIGGHIARAALARGWQVRALRRRPDAVGALGDVAGQIEWVQGELPFDGPGSPNLREAMRSCQVVFHAAAAYPGTEHDPARWVRSSVRQMRAVLQAARDAGAGRFVYTSTLTTVGPPSDPGRLADERDFYVPGSTHSVYCEAKFAMEMEVWRAMAEGLPSVILAPTAVFGPGDVKPTTGELLLRAARGQIPVYFDAIVNSVDVRDVAAAHMAAAGQEPVGQRYIVGGHNLTLLDLLTAAARAARVSPPRRKIPMRLVHGFVGLSNTLRLPVPDLTKTIPDWRPLNSDKARRELGLCPRPFEETARDTIAWFRERHYF